MTETPDMLKTLRDALVECIRHVDNGRPYCWRQASMRKLELLGLVSGTGGKKIRYYRPTAAGRAALEEG